MVRSCDADQPIAEVAASRANRQRLLIAGRRIVDLAIPSRDLALQLGEIDSRLARQGIHPPNQVIERTRDHEVRSASLERLDRRRTGPRDDALE